MTDTSSLPTLPTGRQAQAGMNNENGFVSEQLRYALCAMLFSGQ
jgi:hypothetical protein